MPRQLSLAGVTAALLVLGSGIVSAQPTPPASGAGWGHEAHEVRGKPAVSSSTARKQKQRAVSVPPTRKLQSGTGGKRTAGAVTTRRQKQAAVLGNAVREQKKAAVEKSAPAAKKTEHRLALQVNVNDPAAMNLALNNVRNVADYYRARGESVEIEVVTYGPGLHMLRDDTSPVKDRIKSMSEAMPNVTFMACGNTQQNMKKTESKDIPLISQAKVVESGVVRLMDLQEKGWSYIRP